MCFDFNKTYGDHGFGYIEAHHKVPLYEINAKVETKLSDLAFLCSNCHRMIHRERKDWLSLEELKKFNKIEVIIC